jgi:hypothetical protein
LLTALTAIGSEASRGERAMARLLRIPAIVATVLALSLGTIGCGSSSSNSAATSATTKPANTTPAAAGGSSTVTTGPVRGTLNAANHDPKVGKNWAYTVHVTDAAGKPLAGTVDIEFLFGQQVVGHDTPPTHPLKHGRWHDYLNYPPPAAGQPLTFRAVVHTRLGSITLDWPVKVKP